MAQLMPKLETTVISVHIMYKVDSSDSGIYSTRSERVIWVFRKNRNIRVFAIFKLLCSKGLKKSLGHQFHYIYHVTFRNYCLWQTKPLCPKIFLWECKSFKSLFCSTKIFFVKSQHFWAWLRWILIELVMYFVLFLNQLISYGNPTAYWLKYWFSDIGSFVFSNLCNICISIIYNVAIFDQFDFSLLRNISVTKALLPICLTKKRIPKLSWLPPSAKSH